MEENYAEGILGEPYASSEPLTLATVRGILRQCVGHSEQTFFQDCHDQVSLLEEACAPETVVEELRRAHIRLSKQETGDEPVASGGEDGLMAGFTLNLEDESKSKVPLLPFEVVALATVMPRTVEEAMVLIPSLSRFDPEDLYDKAVLPLLG